MNDEKTYCDKVPTTEPIKFKNLNFVRCIFFSNRQYNIDKIHLPKNILYFEINLNKPSLEKIEKTIDEKLQEIYNNLNRNNPPFPIKIPYPFYIFMARTLEKEGSLFSSSDTFTHTPIGTSQLGISTIENPTGTLAIIDYINSYLNSGIQKESDKDNYERSYYNKYKFKGSVKIFMYFPYLTPAYSYISNFADIVITSGFLVALFESEYFLNFTKSMIIDEQLIKSLQKLDYISPAMIKTIRTQLELKNMNKYNLYEDLVNLCYEGGCVSDIGEDFDSLLYTYTEDEGKNKDNALDKSPFVPTKCLSKTNGFLYNVRYAKNHNRDISTIIKDEGMDEIKSTLKTYAYVINLVNELNDLKKNSGELEKKLEGQPVEDRRIEDIMALINNKTKIAIKDEELTKYTNFMGASPVDLIISIGKKYKKEVYATNENEGEKEIKFIEKDEAGNDKEKTKKIKLNHYSKDYSENIITELAYLNSRFPGVPEIVMSFYLYKPSANPSIITYMPWRTVLLNNKNVLNFNTRLGVNKELKSIANKGDYNYALTINSQGFIYVYNVKTRTIIYFLNRKVYEQIKEVLGVSFSNRAINIDYIDSTNKQASLNALNTKEIASLINEEDPEIKKSLPNNPTFSITINNRTGELEIYGNKFYKSNSSSLQSMIARERSLIEELNDNNNKNMDYINDPANKNSINIRQPQFFTYCSKSNNSCWQ